MKSYIFFFTIIFCIILFAQKNITAQTNPTQSTSLHFNFGSTNQIQLKSYSNVDTKTFYNDKRGYGLLTKQVFPIKKSKKWTDLIPALKSGVKSEGQIKFKTKIRPGEYYIEILMDGGNTGHWQGKIKINDSLIVNEIYSFTSDPESDQPPDYWAVIKKIKVRKNNLLFSIQATNQPSTILALSILPIVKSKINLVDGKITADKNFFAPNYKLSINLINKGNIKEALRYIDAIPEIMFPYQKAKLLLSAAGRLETENPRQLIENALRILSDLENKDNSPEILIDIKAAELYIYADQIFKSGGWDWTKEYTQSGIFNHINFAGMAFEEITKFENHPLQLRAMYELAKVCYWNWVEQNNDLLIEKADKYFKLVKKYYPGNKILNMYLGERIVSVDYPPKDTRIPQWAYLEKKALDGVTDIIHYWVENRQAENGEFGGKYDDDVEMMRWWPISRIAANDSVTLLGMKRLVDGIWKSKWIKNGWSRRLRDVEHSSEPIADTQPMMIGFDYGNPVYIERCMQTLNKINLWTGINLKKHRHFKSSWYSATAIDTTSPKDCDVEMNTRTVKAIRWLAWYNRHPLAMKFLREWTDAWYDDCMRTDKGKPKGIVPAAIRYKDDEICGYTDNWYDSGMFWGYYNFTGGTKMLKEFLVSYLLFRDKKYLEPVDLNLQLVNKYFGKNLLNSKPGSEKWTANILLQSNNFRETIELWRLITGDPKYDELIKMIGSDYIKFRLTNNEEYLKQGCKNIIDNSYVDRELITTEAYFTDRVEIRNLRGGPDYGSTHLESMYAGSPLANAFYPFQAISWRGFGNNFAAIVLDSSPHNLKIRIINLRKNEINGSIVFHQLENGKYKFKLTSPDSGQSESESTFEVRRRNSELNIFLPALREKIINITQIEKYPSENFELADLAITKSELKLTDLKNGKIAVSIPIHNIGIRDAEHVEISLLLKQGNRLKEIDRKIIVKLKAPLDLLAKVKKIEFIISKNTGIYEIRIDENSTVDEITKLNNKIRFSIN